MFRSKEDFTCIVFERKRNFPELSFLEIIIQIQEEYRYDDDDIMKLLDNHLISAIESEAIKNKQLKIKSKPLF